MQNLNVDSIIAYFNSPLTSDHHILLDKLHANNQIVHNFEQAELQALINFALKSNDTYSTREVLRLFLKCNCHRLAMFDDDLVPYFLSCTSHSSPEIRFFSVSNLAIMSEKSERVAEEFFRNTNYLSSFMDLIRDESLNGEIRQQALIFLRDISRGQELDSLDPFEKCIDGLLGVLCTECIASQEISLVDTALKIILLWLTSKKVKLHLIQKDAMDALLELMGNSMFHQLPSKTISAYFAIINELLSCHKSEVCSILMDKNFLSSVVKLLIESLDSPETAKKASLCLRNLALYSDTFVIAIGHEQYINDLTYAATSNECNETANEITFLLCWIMAQSSEAKRVFCFSPKSIEMISTSIVKEYETEKFRPHSLVLLHAFLEKNMIMKNSLSDSVTHSGKSFLSWLIDCLRVCSHAFSDEDKDTLSSRSIFSLWMFRLVMVWLDDSAIAVHHATSIVELVAGTCHFLSSALQPLSNFTRIFHTLAFLTTVNLFHTTHDMKWIDLIKTEMRISSISACCEPCLKTEYEKPGYADSHQTEILFPISATFQRKMQTVYATAAVYISSQPQLTENPSESDVRLDESVALHESSTAQCAEPFATSEETNNDESTVSSYSYVPTSHDLPESTQDHSTLEAIQSNDTGAIICPLPTLSEIRDLDSLHLRFEAMKVGHAEEIALLKKEMALLREDFEQQKSHTLKLQARIEQISSFQNL